MPQQGSSTPPEHIRVVVADDHPMWRDAVARDLADAGFEVVATADDGRSAVARTRATAPDVLVLDLNLPGLTGAQVCAALAAAAVPTRILILSASGDHQDVLDAVKAGALGYLVKSAGREEFLAAVRATVVMFDSPRRVKQTLGELCEIEANRVTVICRELTKKFEEVLRGTAAELAARIPDEGLRGEVVILLAPPAQVVVDDDVLRGALAARLDRMSVRDAAAEVAAEHGVARKLAYALAVEMGRDDRG